MYKTENQPFQRFRGPPEREVKLLKEIDLTKTSTHLGWFREKKVMQGYKAWLFEDGEVWITKPGLLSKVDILCHFTQDEIKRFSDWEKKPDV